jgi:hypothetical protein
MMAGHVVPLEDSAAASTWWFVCGWSLWVASLRDAFRCRWHRTDGGRDRARRVLIEGMQVEADL